jgi:hypothetical protein
LFACYAPIVGGEIRPFLLSTKILNWLAGAAQTPAAEYWIDVSGSAQGRRVLRILQVVENTSMHAGGAAPNGGARAVAELEKVVSQRTAIGQTFEVTPLFVGSARDLESLHRAGHSLAALLAALAGGLSARALYNTRDDRSQADERDTGRFA